MEIEINYQVVSCLCHKIDIQERPNIYSGYFVSDSFGCQYPYLIVTFLCRRGGPTAEGYRYFI